jgi:hypothetical protein
MVPLVFPMCLLETLALLLLVVISSFLMGIPTTLLFFSIFSHPLAFSKSIFVVDQALHHS